MACNKNENCNYDFNIKTVGVCDVSRIRIDSSNRNNLNWTEISVPEILYIPELKPDIEAIDQVYANIFLDNVKLIETPFAYKKYILYSFYTSTSGLAGALPGLITSLTTAVTNLLTPLETTLITALNALETALNLLVAVPGVPALITVVQGLETTITNLINSIDTALLAVSTAATNLITAITTVPFSAQLICAAIQSLIDTLNALNILVNSIIGILTDMVDTLDAAAATIGNLAVTTAVGIATTAINLLINTTLPPLILIVTNSIVAILNLLAPVDCTQAYAFELIDNAEGTRLTGRKLIIEGILKQKIVYTAEVNTQSVHSAHYEVPFIAFIIPYAKFEGLNYQEGIVVYDPATGGSKTINGYIYNETVGINVDLCEEFSIEKCIEDIFIYPLDSRSIFKNVTVFLKATPNLTCN